MTPGKPAVCYETSLDESFLVGTREELRKLAMELLAVIEVRGDEIDYLGVPVHFVSERLTEHMGDIVLDGVAIVEDVAAKRELMNRIHRNNGEPPIDWAALDRDE